MSSLPPVTDWFPAHVPPVLSGVYEVVLPGEGCGWYAMFWSSSGCWGAPRVSPHEAACAPLPSATQVYFRWRGLSADPARWAAMQGLVADAEAMASPPPAPPEPDVFTGIVPEDHDGWPPGEAPRLIFDLPPGACVYGTPPLLLAGGAGGSCSGIPATREYRVVHIPPAPDSHADRSAWLVVGLLLLLIGLAVGSAAWTS